MTKKKTVHRKKAKVTEKKAIAPVAEEEEKETLNHYNFVARFVPEETPEDEVFTYQLATFQIPKRYKNKLLKMNEGLMVNTLNGFMQGYAKQLQQEILASEQKINEALK